MVALLLVAPAAMLLSALAQPRDGAAAHVSITTQTPMLDENGHPIDGPDGCLIPHVYDFNGTPGHNATDRWWSYGLSLNSSAGVVVNCYASADLARWSKRSCRMQNEPGKSKPNLWANVLYNRLTRQYVVFTEATTQWIEVYTGPTPMGPFTFRQNFSVPGFPGDMTIFQDPDDEKAYLVYNSFYDPFQPHNKQRTMERFTFTYALNASYLSDTANVNLSSVHNTSHIMEGLWMTKDRGTYYLFGSPLVCDDVGDDFYLSAPSPEGPWTYRGLFAPKGSLTFHSQVFRGFEVRGSSGVVQHVFVGLRWCHYPPGDTSRSAASTAASLPAPRPLGGSVDDTSLLTEFEWVRSTHAQLMPTNASSGSGSSSKPHCSTCHCCLAGPQKTGQPGAAGLVFGPSGIWLPIHFNANGTVAEMEWYDRWELDTGV
jgi:hypothetical protein